MIWEGASNDDMPDERRVWGELDLEKLARLAEADNFAEIEPRPVKAWITDGLGLVLALGNGVAWPLLFWAVLS